MKKNTCETELNKQQSINTNKIKQEMHIKHNSTSNNILTKKAHMKQNSTNSNILKNEKQTRMRILNITQQTTIY